jgi:hypothetical protein
VIPCGAYMLSDNFEGSYEVVRRAKANQLGGCLKTVKRNQNSPLVSCRKSSDLFQSRFARGLTPMLCSQFFHRVACSWTRSAAFVMALRCKMPKRERHLESEGS